MDTIKKIGTVCAVFAKNFYTAIAANKKLFVILLYLVLIHFAECLAWFIGKVNGTLFNPFLQGLWSWVALFGLALLCGNIAFKLFLTFIIVIQALEAACSSFLSIVFSLRLRADAFAVLAVSSPEEVKEFYQMFIGPLNCVMAACFIGIIICILIFLWKSTLKKSLYMYILAILMFLPQGINTLRYCLQERYDKIYERNSICDLIAQFIDYKNNSKHLTKMAENPVLPKNISTKKQENITCVLVIGESATRFHHSIYGYPRNTSPELSKRRNEMLIFNNAVSAYSNTVQSCSYMFTTQEVNNKSDFRYSFIDIFKAAGYKIVLLSNQYRWGEFDSPISLMTAHAHERHFLQEIKAGSYDDALYPLFCRAIESSDQRKLIILHLHGSHADYSNRYPASEGIFNADNRINNIPYHVDKKRVIDEYDNSILFTDKLLGKLCTTLSRRNEPAFMLYIADHGEFPEQASSNPRSGASKNLEYYEIPFVLYGNKQYRNKFAELWTAAGKNTDRAFRSDWLMYPLYSAAGITYEDFPENKNLFSSSYEPPEKIFLGDSSCLYTYRKNPYLDTNTVSENK